MINLLNNFHNVDIKLKKSELTLYNFKKEIITNLLNLAKSIEVYKSKYNFLKRKESKVVNYMNHIFKNYKLCFKIKLKKIKY